MLLNPWWKSVCYVILVLIQNNRRGDVFSSVQYTRYIVYALQD
jgi:hypothetical protein